MSEEYEPELAVVSLGDEHEPDYGTQLPARINTTDLSTTLSEDFPLAIFENKFGYTNGTANMGSSTDVSSGGELTVCTAHQAELDRYCRTEGRSVCQNCVNQGTCRNHTVIQLNIRAAAVRVSHKIPKNYTKPRVL